jgi:hypothetical protein
MTHLVNDCPRNLFYGLRLTAAGRTVLMRFGLTTRNSGLTGFFLLAAATMFGGVIWSIKEFNSRTDRPTPDWLRQTEDRGS